MSLLKKKKEKEEEPKYIIESVEYGDKDFVECMKAIIRNKLSEN